MAIESVASGRGRGLTTQTGFDRVGCDGTVSRLFDVRGGIDAQLALFKAAALAESIEHLASDAVSDRMDAEVAGLVAFAADAIKALIHSVDGAYPLDAGAEEVAD